MPDIALSRTASPSVQLSHGLARLARVLLWAILCVMVVYPLVMVLLAAAAPSIVAEESLRWSDFMTDRLTTAWLNTFRLGLVVSLLSVALGAGAALLAMQSQRDFWLDLLLSIPFLTPPFLASLAWTLAVGRRGYLSKLSLPGVLAEEILYSFWGMALVMAVHYAPLVYFAMRAQLAKIPASLLWAGKIAGASSWNIIWRIQLPLAMPALLAGGFLAFASGIEEFGTPLVIGNRIGYPVISTEIGRLVSVYPINLTLASALASTLLVLAGGVYFVSYLVQRARRTSSHASMRAVPQLLPGWLRILLWLLVAAFTLFGVIVPYGSMLLTSLLRLISVGATWDNLTLEHYAQALASDSGGLRDALLTSIGLAFFAAVGGTVLGAGAAREHKFLSTLALIPLATPAITMAVGFIRGWNAPWAASLPIYATLWIVGLFYMTQFLPYAVQYARAGMATILPSYEWAARIHGAGGPATLVRIVAPLLWPHCLGGAILIFSVSFRELVGSVLLRPPGVDTVSTFILREFDQGSPAVGMALGIMAIGVALLCITLVRSLVPRSIN